MITGEFLSIALSLLKYLGGRLKSDGFDWLTPGYRQLPGLLWSRGLGNEIGGRFCFTRVDIDRRLGRLLFFDLRGLLVQVGEVDERVQGSILSRDWQRLIFSLLLFLITFIVKLLAARGDLSLELQLLSFSLFLGFTPEVQILQSCDGVALLHHRCGSRQKLLYVVMLRGRLHCFVEVNAAILQNVQRCCGTFRSCVVFNLDQFIRLSRPTSCTELELK